MTNFSALNINNKIIDILEKKGYSTPTPIQEQAIPNILNGNDLIAISQTGTGKTDAFCIPLIQLLIDNQPQQKPLHISSLILAPTRELATQIAENIKPYCQKFNLKYATIYGGVGERDQINNLHKGLDVLIATPGRLIDLTNQNYVKYSDVKILILDEADRMLDMGFYEDIKKILKLLPNKKQTLLFSATMARKIEDLANDILKNPTKIQTARVSSTVDKIDQKIITTSKNQKFSVLHYLLSNHQEGSILIFCQTKHNANRLSTRLAKCGFNNLVMHGNKSQAARDKAIKSFANESVNIMVATDLASRGIDISKITLVINYDLPRDSENYVHRIGRTARAGRSGCAISICEPEEFRKIKLIETLINKQIPREDCSNLKGFKVIELPNAIIGKKINNSEHKKFFGRRNEKKQSDKNPKKPKKFQKYENEFGQKKSFSLKKFGKKIFKKIF